MSRRRAETSLLAHPSAYNWLLRQKLNSAKERKEKLKADKKVRFNQQAFQLLLLEIEPPVRLQNLIAKKWDKSGVILSYSDNEPSKKVDVAIRQKHSDHLFQKPLERGDVAECEWRPLFRDISDRERQQSYHPSYKLSWSQI